MPSTTKSSLLSRRKFTLPGPHCIMLALGTLGTSLYLCIIIIRTYTNWAPEELSHTAPSLTSRPILVC